MKKERLLNLERLKAYFDSIGFFESVYSENNFDFDFYKKTKDLNYLITLRYGLRNRSFYIGSTISVSIISETVNNILEKFTYTKGINEDVLLAFPNYNKNIDDETLNQLKNLPIQTEADFEIVLRIIATHIETYILPFFDKVPNLQTINDEVINKLSHEEYSIYIKGETNFKVLIIMKLCNNPNYNTFKQTLIEMYDYAIKVDAKKYMPDYEAFHNILNYLEGGQYQEILS